MKKINLKEFDVFTDISKRQRVRCDMRRSVANLLYNQMHGIEALNLALTIHRSEGELSLIDAFAEHVKEYNGNPQTE